MATTTLDERALAAQEALQRARARANPRLTQEIVAALPVPTFEAPPYSESLRQKMAQNEAAYAAQQQAIAAYQGAKPGHGRGTKPSNGGGTKPSNGGGTGIGRATGIGGATGYGGGTGNGGATLGGRALTEQEAQNVLTGADQSLQQMNQMVDQGMTNQQILAALPIPASEVQKYEDYLNHYRAQGQSAYTAQQQNNAVALYGGGSSGPPSGGGAGNGGLPAMPSVGTPTVTPAPEYTPSPEEVAWAESYQGQLENWVASGGYGIPEEVQGQMIQRQTDTLKAKEAENIRVMRNDMERRGLTNSGYVFSNEMKIRAATTQAIANSMTDIQIQSSLMKLASYEKAMGAMGEFLGYLSAQSQLAYAPKSATWSAQQQANLAAYQAQQEANRLQYQAQQQTKLTQYQAQHQANLAAYQAQQQANLTQYQAQHQVNLAQYQAQVQTNLTAYQAQQQATLTQYQAQVQAVLTQYQVQAEMIRSQMVIAAEERNQAANRASQEKITQWQLDFDRWKVTTEVDAAAKAAKTNGIGNVLGTISGIGLVLLLL